MSFRSRWRSRLAWAPLLLAAGFGLLTAAAASALPLNRAATVPAAGLLRGSVESRRVSWAKGLPWLLVPAGMILALALWHREPAIADRILSRRGGGGAGAARRSRLAGALGLGQGAASQGAVPSAGAGGASPARCGDDRAGGGAGDRADDVRPDCGGAVELRREPQAEHSRACAGLLRARRAARPGGRVARHREGREPAGGGAAGAAAARDDHWLRRDHCRRSGRDPRRRLGASRRARADLCGHASAGQQHRCG